MSAATIREQQTVDDPPTAPCRVCGHLELGGNDSSDDGEYDSDKSERYCFATPQEFRASALDGSWAAFLSPGLLRVSKTLAMLPAHWRMPWRMNLGRWRCSRRGARK
jgi:hypothetical protein